MERGKAVAIVECNGLPTAIAFLDTALKSANVKLLGMELVKGEGKVDIKLMGNIGAVKAATDAGIITANRIGGVSGKVIIPRPHDNIDCLLKNDFVMHPLKRKKVNGCNLQSRFLNQETEMDNKVEIEESCKTDLSLSIDYEKAKNKREGIAESSVLSKCDERAENQKEVIEDNSVSPKIDEDEKKLEIDYTCNLCKDPKCTRVKGKPHVECIHYNEDR
jgi:microcompartment protein CcmL/EutN